jgi:hypothetical protein
MSDTLHLACVQCRKELWIGQDGIAAAYLYTDEEHRDRFDRFYSDHRGHDIRFVNMDGLDRLDLLGEEHEFK